MKDRNSEITQLISRALKGEHSKFEFIKTWSQAAFVMEYYRAMKKIITAMNKAYKAMYKQYLKEASEGNNDEITTVGSIYQLDTCIKFYTKERELIYNILDEFYCYCLLGGNIWNILAGEERPDEHLTDYRIKRLKIW